MSHTTSLKSVAIRDVHALRAAVAELQAAGVNCNLAQNVQPRMYYGNQHGKCDFVLQLPNSRFDVGFDKQADGSYIPVFDEFGNCVGKEIGATCPIGRTAEERAAHQIGRLMQSYAKHTTINAAVSQGYCVESTMTDSDGNLHLVLSGMG